MKFGLKLLPNQIVRKLASRFRTSEKQKFIKKSYSQSGEDLIVKFIFNCRGVFKPSYLDIGAHHPFFISNTALFYQNGSRGINIEPDPNLFKKFPKYREKDINLNIGIGAIDSHQELYMLSASTLNTFSKEEAQRNIKEGNYQIEKVQRIQVNKIETVLEEYNKGIFPDFLNIDAEGVDELIIQSIDFDKNFPTVICIETISFSTNGKGKKNSALIDFITSKGYLLYADTNINSIFVRKEFWQKK